MFLRFYSNSTYETSVLYESTDVLEHILSHKDCDVDPVNRIDKATPLHIAVQIKDAESRLYICESLLEAGADTSCVLSLQLKTIPRSFGLLSIRDKNQETVLDIIPAQDVELRALIRKYQAQASVSKYDVASGEHC